MSPAGLRVVHVRVDQARRHVPSGEVDGAHAVGPWCSCADRLRRSCRRAPRRPRRRSAANRRPDAPWHRPARTVPARSAPQWSAGRGRDCAAGTSASPRRRAVAGRRHGPAPAHSSCSQRAAGRGRRVPTRGRRRVRNVADRRLRPPAAPRSVRAVRAARARRHRGAAAGARGTGTLANRSSRSRCRAGSCSCSRPRRRIGRTSALRP